MRNLSMLAMPVLLLTACAMRSVPAATPLPTSPPLDTPIPTPQATKAAVQLSSIELAGEPAPVTQAALSPDGRLIATTAGDWISTDPTVRLWRTDGSLVKVLRGHTAPVLGMAWSPDGQLLATGSLDGTVRLWQPDGTLVDTLRGSEPLVAVAWSPDGRSLASASTPLRNPVVWLWRRDGTLVTKMSTQYTGGKFYNLDWSPDGKLLLGGAIDYKLWRADGTEVFHLEACPQCTPAWGAAWSPDSKRWAIGNESGQVDVYDIEGHALAHLQNQHGNADALAWSPDGDILAGGDGVNLWRNDGSLLASHASFGRVDGLAWSPGGELLASRSTSNGLRVWSADGRLLAAFPGSVIMIAWSPDGELLAASTDQTIHLWRLKPSVQVH